jgi:hypothetical protein
MVLVMVPSARELDSPEKRHAFVVKIG